MQYLLDTNTCIAAMRRNAAVVAHMSTLSPNDCAVSTITAYELETGVEKCADPTKERAKVEHLLRAVHVLPFDADSARRAAQVRAALEKAGQPIGPYDLLLAGHAMAFNLVLVTRNLREFSRVAELRLENWEQ